MSEAELTDQIVEMMNLTLQGISVFFAIISAYIVGLFYFLHRSPFVLRLGAYFLFLFSTAFIALFTHGANLHFLSLLDALEDLSDQTKLSAVGEGVLDRAYGDIDPYLLMMMWSGLGVIVLALTYLTFLHRWPSQRSA